MPTRITPLHRALGVAGGVLADLVPLAVAQNTVEAEDLDWKRELPHPSKPTAMLELSTDLAAMANTSGGLIVYGVEEAAAGATTHGAGALATVAAPAAEVDQRLHQAAYQAQPPIRQIVVEAFTVPSGEQLYAVHVAASEEAPHLVVDRDRRDWFRAPIRHGAHTQYMTERQLEQAYSDRFGKVRRREEILLDLVAQCGAYSSVSEHPVLVAVAVPRRPRPGWASELTEEEARFLFASASRFESPPFPADLPRQMLPNGRRTRVGLRRWVDQYDDDRSEIHHDGSVACAFKLGPWRAEPEVNAAANEVASTDIEALACEFVMLMHDVGRKLSIDSYDVRVEIRWRYPEPVAIRAPHPMLSRHFVAAERDKVVHRFVPVVLTVTVSPDAGVRVSDASQIATDLLAQGGLLPASL